MDTKEVPPFPYWEILGKPINLAENSFSHLKNNTIIITTNVLGELKHIILKVCFNQQISKWLRMPVSFILGRLQCQLLHTAVSRPPAHHGYCRF